MWHVCHGGEELAACVEGAGYRREELSAAGRALYYFAASVSKTHCLSFGKGELQVSLALAEAAAEGTAGSSVICASAHRIVRRMLDSASAPSSAQPNCVDSVAFVAFHFTDPWTRQQVLFAPNTRKEQKRPRSKPAFVWSKQREDWTLCAGLSTATSNSEADAESNQPIMVFQRLGQIDGDRESRLRT